MNLVQNIFSKPVSLWPTIGLALLWLALMLGYTPLADRIATKWVKRPPTLKAFRGLQQSRTKFIMGIILAWILGGFLEELVFRGIVLQWVEQHLSSSLTIPWASAIAIVSAALGAGLFHVYQGTRAVLIITQLSVWFGVLFVISGFNFWAVFLCHGLYDTVAFIRFANKKSRYSQLENDGAAV
jgi:membrane protease YdiL (CAAX protease family)